MIRAKTKVFRGPSSVFTITDQGELVGGSFRVQQAFKKAIVPPIEVWQGPVAWNIYRRMSRTISLVLVLRKDPVLAKGLVH